MRHYLCSNIAWDTDGEEVELPTTVYVSISVDDCGVDLDEILADELSSRFGFCMYSFTFEEV